MGQITGIEWTASVGPDGAMKPGATFNPWRGCTKVSAGCANCYAETLSGRNPKTLGVWGPQGTRVVAAESAWREPLKWDRDAKRDGVRRRVFCASLADVFEDWTGPMSGSDGKTLVHLYPPSGTWTTDPGDHADKVRVTMHDVRRRLFDLIDSTPNLDWLVLTKRPENIAKMMPEYHPCGRAGCEVLHTRLNLWLGASVENQAAADERIPHLLRTPAAVRFLSCEPLLEAVDLRPHMNSKRGYFATVDSLTCNGKEYPKRGNIDWVIVGGESGHGARPMHPDWARSLRDQCTAAGVAYFFKQHGEFVEVDTSYAMPDADPYQAFDDGTVVKRVGKKAAGRLLDGREWSEFPGMEAKS